MGIDTQGRTLLAPGGETPCSGAGDSAARPPPGYSSSACSPLQSTMGTSSNSSARMSPRVSSGAVLKVCGKTEDHSGRRGFASGSAATSSGETTDGNHVRGGLILRASSIPDVPMKDQGQGGGAEREGRDRWRHFPCRLPRRIGPHADSEESNATTAATAAPSPSSRPLPVLRPPGGESVSQPSTIDEEARRGRIVCLTSFTGSNLSMLSGSSKPPRSGCSVRSRDMSEKHVGWRETSMGRHRVIGRSPGRKGEPGELESENGATDGADGGELDYAGVFERSARSSSLARESSTCSKPKSHSFFLRMGHAGGDRHGREMSAVGWLRKTSSRAKLLVAEGADAMFGAEINLFTGRQDKARELRRTSKGSRKLLLPLPPPFPRPLSYSWDGWCWACILLTALPPPPPQCIQRPVCFPVALLLSSSPYVP